MVHLTAVIANHFIVVTANVESAQVRGCYRGDIIPLDNILLATLGQLEATALDSKAKHISSILGEVE